MKLGPDELRARLSRVKLLVVDVDGVLTDGALHYGPEGETLKSFHVRDGLGLRRLIEGGVEAAVITARQSEPLARRMEDLAIERFYPGRHDKRAALAELCEELGVAPGDVAYAGDDLLDLPVMEDAGLAIAVADAHRDVRRVAGWVTSARGGRGAVREIADAILAARQTGESDFRVVIPARYAASRLPGKPLREIAGRPMIAHVWDRAIEAGAAEVLVATDDPRIAEVVSAFGGEVELTRTDHASGTDRLAEVAENRGWEDAAVVVNLQGDEPCMPGELVASVARALAEHPDAGIATLATPISRAADLFDPNAVKVVLDQGGMARYFSRAPIPWVRGRFDRAAGALEEELPADVPFLRHLGLYAYRVGTLRTVCAAEPHPVEQAESLEQLRALTLGVDIHVTVVQNAPGHGVDTEEDLARVEALLEKEGA